jgi:hypothetical protein
MGRGHSVAAAEGQFDPTKAKSLGHLAKPLVSAF